MKVKIMKPSVNGHRIEFDDGRIVFKGIAKSDTGELLHLIAFRNKEGSDTKLCLSEEAWAAFLGLIRADDARAIPGDFPHKMTWQVVMKHTETGVEE